MAAATSPWDSPHGNHTLEARLPSIAAVDSTEPEDTGGGAAGGADFLAGLAGGLTFVLAPSLLVALRLAG